MSDVDEFWSEDAYFTGPTLTGDMVRQAEELLGYKLPSSYVSLLKTRNGGTPARDCFPTAVPTSWAKDHIALSGIRGIGGDWGIDAPGSGTITMIREWGYPDLGVIVGECPSAGHDVVMLDYSQCGPAGEPQVVHVETECLVPQVTILADNFQAFLDGLVDGSGYDAGV